MSDDEASQRKERAQEIRRRIARGAREASEPAAPSDEPPEGESLKEAIERRMRELDEADGDEQPPAPDERDGP
ncbi:hypothetical protein ACIPUC_02655 [Streptomyces sp. LARHCF249]